MKFTLLFIFLTLTTACTTVNYQGIALSKSGSFNVSGVETGFLSLSQAIVLECEKETEADYVCSKRYPGRVVDLFGNLSMKK